MALESDCFPSPQPARPSLGATWPDLILPPTSRFRAPPVASRENDTVGLGIEIVKIVLAIQRQKRTIADSGAEFIERPL